MNERILTIANKIKQDYGLDNYILKRDHIFSELRTDGATTYLLSLEFFPVKKAKEENEDYNPEGTAVIEVDLHTEEIKRIIFVNDVSFANEAVFPNSAIEDVIEWIENMTGMMFGKQFKIEQIDERKFIFQAAIDHIEVAPAGYIEVKFNDANQLTTYSIDGDFPQEDEIEWEPFDLTKETILEEIKERFTLTEIPIENEKKWKKIWQIQPFYIRNDLSESILPETLYHHDTYISLNQKIEWKEPSTRKFKSEDVNLSTEISFEEAMKKVTVKPITDLERITCLDEAKEFLCSLYPEESGVWTVTGMYPEKNYIFVELKGNTFKVFQRKVKVIIDRNRMKVVNHWDSQYIVDMYNSFQEAEATNLDKEEAFESIRKSIKVTPVYVKVPKTDKYQLSGRVDCDVVIEDHTGKIISVNDL